MKKLIKLMRVEWPEDNGPEWLCADNVMIGLKHGDVNLEGVRFEDVIDKSKLETVSVNRQVLSAELSGKLRALALTSKVSVTREERLAELRSCGVDEERIEKAIELEGKLLKLTNHRLRSTACDIAEKLHETAANLDKYIEEKDYIWAADDILLLIEHGKRLKHELLRVGINVDE